MECINRFPLFGRFERVLGPPVQRCCSLRFREVWLLHGNFFTIFRSWIGSSLIAIGSSLIAIPPPLCPRGAMKEVLGV